MHLAAQINVRTSVDHPLLDADVNVLGTINIVNQAVKHGVHKLIFSSSGGAIYGEQKVFPAPESHPTNPMSPYGISKLCGEHYLSYFQRTSRIGIVCLRYANVYGPRQDPEGEAGVVSIFLEKMLVNDQPVINGDGKQTRDFVYVDDVARANLLAIGENSEGIYNVGTGIETSINDLFRRLVDLTGSTCKEVHGPAKQGEQTRSVIDPSRIKQDLGWAHKVEFDVGIKNTVAYFRKKLGVERPPFGSKTIARQA
jgi:UDP-glucose 4-epimerase